MVTAVAAGVTALMRGRVKVKVPPVSALHVPKLPKLPRVSTLGYLSVIKDDQNMVETDLVQAEDFSEGYRRFRLKLDTPLELELGQRIFLRAGAVTAPVALASVREDDLIDVILPSKTTSTYQGLLEEDRTLQKLCTAIDDGDAVAVAVAKATGLRYDGQDLPVRRLTYVAGGASAVASACAELQEILGDKETSVEEASLVAYCRRSSDFGKSMILLEQLEKRFPARLNVQRIWLDTTFAESAIIESTPAWSPNSMAVVLGPNRFTSTISKQIATAKKYPENVILTI